jgi:hypothetical protein
MSSWVLDPVPFFSLPVLPSENWEFGLLVLGRAENSDAALTCFALGFWFFLLGKANKMRDMAWHAGLCHFTRLKQGAFEGFLGWSPVPFVRKLLGLNFCL